MNPLHARGDDHGMAWLGYAEKKCYQNGICEKTTVIAVAKV